MGLEGKSPVKDGIISKTIYTFVVLHRTDDPPETLEIALREAYDGSMVGMETFSTTRLGNYNVEGELKALGNDGTFFEDDLTPDPEAPGGHP